MAARKKSLTRDDPIQVRAPEIIRRLSEAYPDAHVALEFSNPLEMLGRHHPVRPVHRRAREHGDGDSSSASTGVAEDYLAVPEDELKADIKPDRLLQPEGHVDP